MERSRLRLLLHEAINSAKTGNLSWARECLGRVLRADPRNEEAWLWMSAVLETTAEKRYCLERALAINPANAQAQAGLRYLDQQAAIASGVAAPERTICPMCGEPNDPAAFQCANCGQDLYVRCPACGERVDIDLTSCAACGQEIGDASDGASYFFHLGELYLQRGQPKRALESWDKTLLLNPDYPRIAEAAAAAFLASGQGTLAIQSIQRAIQEAEDEEHRRELRLRMANYHRQLGNREEASQLYQELLKEDQERREPRADLYAEMGHFSRMDGDSVAARHYYEMAIALDEDLLEVRYALAELLLQDGYEHRALNELRWLQEAGGDVADKAAAKVRALRPPVPEEFRNRWQETLRGTARFFLAGFLLLLLTTGQNWNSVSVLNAVGMLLLLMSGYLLTAATATPRNLPSLSRLSRRLGESPLAMRLRARQKGAKRGGGPTLLQRFLTWQSRSARSLATSLRVTQMRAVKQLQRLAAWSGRTWERVTASRPARLIRGLPQTRAGRFLSALRSKPFFQAAGRHLRRVFPRRAGRPFQRLGEAIRAGGKRLIEQASQVEISEAQFSRWSAGTVGILLLAVGIRLVLL